MKKFIPFLILIVLLSINTCLSAVIPTTQASYTGIGYVNCNTWRLTYTTGSGTGRIVALSTNANWINAASELNYINTNGPFTQFTNVGGNLAGNPPKLNKNYTNGDIYVVANLTSAASSLDITGLAPATAYQCCIYEFAYNTSYPNLQYKSTWAQTPGPPANLFKFTTPYKPPTLVGASQVTSGSAIIAWFDSVSTYSGSYNIYVSEQSNFPNGIFATASAGNRTYTLSGLKAGTKYYYAVQSVLALNSAIKTTVSSAAYFITTFPAPIIAPSGTVQICNGSPQTLTFTATAGITYQWYYNGAAISGQTGASYTVVNQSGSYSVIGTDAYGNTQTSNTVIVNISTMPTPSLTNRGVCRGESTVLTPSNISQTSYSFKWYDAVTGGTKLYEGYSYTVTPSVTTTYYLELSHIASGCVSSSRTPVIVEIWPMDKNVTMQDMPTEFCANQPITLTPMEPPINDFTFRYYLDKRGGAPFYEGKEYTFMPTAGTVYEYFVEAVNDQGCPSPQRTPITLKVLDNLSMPTFDPVNACAGTNINITPKTPDPNVYNFQWYTVSQGGTPFYTGKTYNVTPTGNVSYYVETIANGCVSSSRQKLDITVSSKPAKVQINSPIQACVESTITLQPNNPDPNCTYRLYSALTGGYKYQCGDGTPINVVVISGNVTYYMEAVNLGGCASERTPIEIIGTPQPDVAIIPSSLLLLCTPSYVNLTPSNINTALYKYNWYKDGALVFTGSVFSPYINKNVGYEVEVEDISTGCRSRKTYFQVEIEDLSPSVVIDDYYICGSLPSLDLIPKSPDLTTNEFHWFASSGSLLYIGDTYTLTPAPTTTTTYLVATSNQCGVLSPTTSFTVHVQQSAPLPPGISTNSLSACKGDLVEYIPQSPNPATHTFIVYDSPTGNVVSNGHRILIPATTPGTYNYYVESMNASGCKSGQRTTIQLTVTPTHPPFAFTNQYEEINLGQTVTFTPYVAGTYNWYDSYTSTTPIFTGGTYTCKPDVSKVFYAETVPTASYCKSDRMPAIVVVHNDVTPKPVLSIAYCNAATNTIEVVASYPDINLFDIYWYSDKACTQPIAGGSSATKSLVSSGLTKIYAKAINPITNQESEVSELNLDVACFFPAPNLKIVKDCNYRVSTISMETPAGYDYAYSCSFTECSNPSATLNIEAMAASPESYIVSWGRYQIKVYALVKVQGKADVKKYLYTLVYDCGC